MKKVTDVHTEVLTIELNSRTLLRELLSVGRTMSTNLIVGALENVFVSLTTGKIHFTGDNLKESITSTVEYNIIGETGTFLLPHKKTVELLKTLPDVPVSIIHTRIEKVCSVQINVDGKKFKLSTEPWEEFPKRKAFSGSQLTMPVKQLKEAITRCLATVSVDTLRPAMMGIHIQTEKGDFVSTDGHSLTLYSTGFQMDAKPFTITASFAKLILESLSEDQENITLEVSDKNVQISNEHLTIISQLIDERFVAYEGVLPKNQPLKGVIDIAQWSTALRRAAIFANATTLATKHTFSNGRLTIKSEDLDYGNDSVQEISYEGDFEILIGFNGRLLNNILSKLDSNTARIELSEPNRAMLIYPDNTLAQELIILMMPVMLETYL
ncbi:DNA polymerase III subunit beta [Dyadobacter sp. CY343]|uniref:DNA polymerase III subunit beta n=1 Tax=Dyadobacter sp. CY343 TaxID=2907299 RepID=UPI001F28DAC2|nr:DNA polymerase III subunit beta [Dyadobacter sp. CY343]MCE7061233.1 DNA polymerase III subunit beta [Dyadobacter sp. CY343]